MNWKPLLDWNSDNEWIKHAEIHWKPQKCYLRKKIRQYEITYWMHQMSNCYIKNIADVNGNLNLKQTKLEQKIRPSCTLSFSLLIL